VKRAMIFVLATLLLAAASIEIFGQQDASGATSVIELDASAARKEIEARYAELAEAVRNKDFAAFQALRTKDFSARLRDGDVHTSAQMAARVKTLFAHIQAPISFSNQIELLMLMDNEAIAIVHQQFSRQQEIAGEFHLIETSIRQRETWVKTGDGWKLKFIDNIDVRQTLVDGRNNKPEE
jgi:ketosteroid isomerase-like protein